MADEPLFLFLATYGDEADARLDYEAIKELHSAGAIGTYDAAVITKDADGKVKVHKHEKATQHGAWTGIAVGAVVGILFPPAILVDAAIGGLAGGAIGHFWRGMSRKDVKELGELLDEGDAALLVIGKATLEKALEKAVSRSDKQIEREIKADHKELEKELKEAGKAIG
ncbi:MAG TPA: DUF1269 domain-containing protein [Thermoleophilia bacterium]|nr:DUF1269 domain-containing protein [Thermoleophilia bacterium]